MQERQSTDNIDEVNTDQSSDTPEKHDVVGVRFKSCGKVYTFAVDDIEVTPGARVVVDSEIGLSIGRIVTPKQTLEKSGAKLKKVVRIASDKDFEKVEKNRSFCDEAKAFCIEKARDLNLPMKIVTAETTLDRKRLTFYFTADGRIDFRELVRDLASQFKTRIEMRQIGVRDEVKLLGGIGVCGRQTCCRQFLTSFAPITIRMAKQQALSINQSKLSGICGRLMCCLSYEFNDRGAEREGPGGKKEEFVTVTEKILENDLEEQSAVEIHDDEYYAPDDVPKQVPGRESAEAASHPQDAAEEKKKMKRHRRKKKRGRAFREKPKDEAASAAKEPEKKEQRTDEPGKRTRAKRRRRFWKKKKKEDAKP
jgi:cell fate regulator YaaT (PSP1 superfamily)